MKRVKDKVIIVTGGASGIGKATSLLLAEQGARVVIADIDVEKGKHVVNQINAQGNTAHFYQVNVSREAEVQNAITAVYEKEGKINVLINNAGISGAGKPTHEISESEWDRLMDVNVKGVFFCTKHAVPFMKKNGSGSIINMSSIYGMVSAPNAATYSATKGAVRGMTKSDALLYAPDKIRVNSIHPGHVWTPLLEAYAKTKPEGAEKFKKDMDGLYPLGQMGEPRDIAYGILYLASDESKFMTGAELVIDGGYTAR